MEKITTRAFTVAVGIWTIAALPAFATSFVSSNVSAAPVSGPAVTQGSGTPGQMVSATVDSGNFAQALTDYGVNKAYASSTYYQDFAQASSDWQIGFTLLANGVPVNTFETLTITYSYDFSLTTSAGFGSPSTGYYLSGAFGIAGNNASQGNLFEVFHAGATSNADGSLESCKTKIPGGATPQQCLGSYNGSGSLVVMNNFHIGQNRIETEVIAGAAIGVLDAYNTGLVTGIVVPDGVTWTYDTNVAGNPLNFHYAAAGTPEPGTFGILGLGLAAMAAARRLRARRSSRAAHAVPL